MTNQKATEASLAMASEAQLGEERRGEGAPVLQFQSFRLAREGYFPLLGARLVFGAADEMKSVLLSRRSRISSRSDFITRSWDLSQSEQLAMPTADGFS